MAANSEPTLVRIIAVPKGEAPDWVREKWVGLELPTFEQIRGPHTLTGWGVVTGPPPTSLEQFDAGYRGRLQVMSGFCVKTTDAIAILNSASPEAAAWWRENFLRSGAFNDFLMFEKECCLALI